MRFDEFCDKTTKILNSYYNFMNYNKDRIVSTGVPLFPETILYRNHTKHYSFELVGGRRKFNEKLSEKRIESGSVNDFLSLFHRELSKPGIAIRGNRVRLNFTQLCFSHNADPDEFKERFPFLENYQTILIFTFDMDVSVWIPDECLKYTFERFCIIEKKENFYRCKNISAFCVFPKNVERNELDSLIGEELFKPSANSSIYTKSIEPFGIYTVRDDAIEMHFMASHLQNLYLSADVREVIIGDFLQRQPAIIEKAFGARKIWFETSLDWIDSEFDMDEKSIRPDLILKRDDGDFIIIDLKLAKIDRKNMYKGSTSRRRYVDYVNEGIAQLKNYRRYFETTGNRAYASDKLGEIVSISETILIVGNDENMPFNEIARLSKDNPDVVIMTYDTLVSAFLKTL